MSLKCGAIKYVAKAAAALRPLRETERGLLLRRCKVLQVLQWFYIACNTKNTPYFACQ